ncbi:MAG TPA: hypothetical protein VF054_14215 [Micromonosporaceae bacterium]
MHTPSLDRRLTQPGLTITVAGLVAVYIDHRPGQAATCGTCHHRYTAAAPLCPSATLARQLLKHRQHEDRQAVEPIRAELHRTRDDRTLPEADQEHDRTPDDTSGELFPIEAGWHRPGRRAA